MKLTEVRRSMELIEHFMEKQEEGEKLTTQYNLADTVYATAQVDCEGTVCLWLGAGVMVEYTYKEAMDLMKENEKSAIEKMAENKEDLAFVQSQRITTEVNMARVFNWDVKRRRAEKEEADKKGAAEAK